MQNSNVYLSLKKKNKKKPVPHTHLHFSQPSWFVYFPCFVLKMRCMSTYHTSTYEPQRWVQVSWGELTWQVAWPAEYSISQPQVLASEGFFHFRNWFDDRSWYPLGRVVGESIHSGLVAIAANIYWILNCFNTTVNIRVICVYLPPCIASVTTIFAYGVAKEVNQSWRQLIPGEVLPQSLLSTSFLVFLSDCVLIDANFFNRRCLAAARPTRRHGTAHLHK